MKIIEKALKSCDNVFLQIDEELIQSNEMKSLLQLMQKYDNGNLILSKSFSMHENSLVNKIIIFFLSEDETEVDAKIILTQLTQTIKFISRNSQREIEKLIFIFPPNFDINQLENIFCYENRIFYLAFENQNWLEKIMDPENYTYTYSKISKTQNQSQKTIFHQRQPSSKPKFELTESNHINYNYNCKSFMKYNKFSGLYLNEQLQCIQVQFKIQIGNSIPKQLITNIITWMKDKIFFIQQHTPDNNFNSEQHAIFEDLISSAPLISCLQTINYIILEQIEHNCLKDRLSHLRYLTILVGSGMIANVQDLNALQQVFFEALHTPVVNLNVTPPISPHHFRLQSNLTGRTTTFKKQKSIEPENFDGYSYDLSQIDKRTNQDIMQENLDDSLFQSDHLVKYKRIVSVNNPTQRPYSKYQQQSPVNQNTKYYLSTLKDL